MKGEALLIDPTAEDPRLHLVLSLSTGIFVGLTEKGSETIRVFGLNWEILIRGRIDAWVALKALLGRYGECRCREDGVGSIRILDAIKRYPFSCVLIYLVGIAASDRSLLLVGQEVMDCLASFPEVIGWMPGGRERE